MRVPSVVVAILAVGLLASPVRAQEPQEPTPLLSSFIRLRAPLVQAIAARDDVIVATARQNAKNVPLEAVKELDREWVEGDDDVPIKLALQKNEAGVLLSSYVRRASTMFSEALLCDQQGALVAAYPIPSDYWQGDEEKFRVAWDTGELFVGKIGFDQSTNAYSAPIAVPVFDDEGRKIGVLIMGVRLSRSPSETTAP